jgi:hypothetical protein
MVVVERGGIDLRALMLQRPEKLAVDGLRGH